MATNKTLKIRVTGIRLNAAMTPVTPMNATGTTPAEGTDSYAIEFSPYREEGDGWSSVQGPGGVTSLMVAQIGDFAVGKVYEMTFTEVKGA